MDSILEKLISCTQVIKMREEEKKTLRRARGLAGLADRPVIDFP
jgi:hypothetical protein